MAYLNRTGTDDLASWIRKELKLGSVVTLDKRGNSAKKIQEWLSHHGYGAVIDGHYGFGTQQSVKEFQAERGLVVDGVVGNITFSELTQPLMTVLQPLAETSISTFSDAMKTFALQHLKEHPREIGGNEKGQWVRSYMKGKEGVPYYWCAGFVTFLMKQAAEQLGVSSPLPGSFSCDTLSCHANHRGLLINEKDASPIAIKPGSIFLVRKNDLDWTHTGIVTEVFENSFRTVEGNTNDSGDRNGYEVCSRIRNYTKKDFIVFK